ncbi:uncharacterized protein [Dermacentor andersoni]|uniref:uncharacterized protein n=1 Tax=Dermacentor andersoni TaxID=34620 RepID=UPI00241722C7|nr:uncharacterized protein LOC129386533 [Dermacentor andersoni]
MVILSCLTLLSLMLPFGSPLPQWGLIEQREDAQCFGKEGSSCYVLTYGYNEEIDYKRGTCKDGKCQYSEIPKGCESKLKHLPSPSGKQVGCAFTCYEDGQTKFNYFPPGTKCRHAIAPGKYVDGTCFKEEPSGKVHCKEIPPPLAC